MHQNDNEPESIGVMFEVSVRLVLEYSIGDSRMEDQ